MYCFNKLLLKEKTYPMNMLLEMLSKWPLYFNQGPAALMWSVVHLPFTFIRSTMFSRSLPSHFWKGDSS